MRKRNREIKLLNRKGLIFFNVRTVLAICSFFIIPFFSFSQSTWDGGAGTNNWGDANNWNPNGVPTAATSVTLDNITTVVVNVPATCLNLVIGNTNKNATLGINAGQTLAVTGSLTFNSSNSNGFN